MAREYRKASARASSVEPADPSLVLDGRVRVELPVGVAEVIGGVSEEIERLTGQAGLPIMKAVMVHHCHIHKRRNVKELLPPEFQRSADQRIKAAYGMKDFEQAKAQLEKTVDWLDGINPSAAASLREGLEETLTWHRLGLPEALRKSFQTTNLIESALSVAWAVAGRVKRWRAGDMRLRWIAAGLLAAEKQFRRVRGHKLMPKLLAALDAGAAKIAEGSKAA